MIKRRILLKQNPHKDAPVAVNPVGRFGGRFFLNDEIMTVIKREFSLVGQEGIGDMSMETKEKLS